MGVYMRAVVKSWGDPPFEELCAFVGEGSPFEIRSVGDRGWSEFEAVKPDGTTVVPADLWTGDHAREELDELEEFVEDLEGSTEAREAVKVHLAEADAIVGMQVLPSVYDESVAAANAIIGYLEQTPGVMVQVDEVGWYDGPELVLREPDDE